MAPMRKPPVDHGNAAQIVDVAEIDEMIDDDVAEIHHRHQRLPAGEDFGVGQARQQLGGFLELPRRVIVEGRRLHCPGRDKVTVQSQATVLID